MGTHGVMDVWLDGVEFQEVNERMAELVRLREALEARRKDVAKVARKSIKAAAVAAAAAGFAATAAGVADDAVEGRSHRLSSWLHRSLGNSA